MSLWTMPPELSCWFGLLADCLDARSRARFLTLVIGILFARGRRTVTCWLRAAGIADEFRPAYALLWTVGRRSAAMATRLLLVVLRPLARGQSRLLFGLDDTPTRRYGPCVEGAGVHHNPTPGPAGQTFVYGHVWVTLAWLVRHPCWGCIALPLRASLYVRRKDVPKLPREYRWSFRTKLTLAVELLHWLALWLRHWGVALWLAADGAYACREVLRAARRERITVVSRLRKDAALYDLPGPRPAGRRGRPAIYGKHRIHLAKRAGQRRGWQVEEFELYGRKEPRRYKTFLATWRPAGGVVRVVLVEQGEGWAAFFCTDPEASVADVLTAVADRASIEQAFHDLKEVWGAGQQQLRNLWANVGAFHLNLWLHTLVEVWAWDRAGGRLIDRRASPWDDPSRRPSHADRRRAAQRESLRQEYRAAGAGRGQARKYRRLAHRLLRMMC
jgi:DDE superfamily endonuclease